jgi:hypothetical protein
MSLFLSLFGADAQGDLVLTEVQHHFEHLGIDVTETRTLDPATGLIERIALDSDGVPVDIDALRMEEQRLKIEARGKISPELGERIEQAQDSDELQTAFWLTTAKHPDFRKIMDDAQASGMSPEDARRLARDEGEKFYSPYNLAFADRLKSEGHSVDYVGTAWPIVIATVPTHTIGSIAARDEVDQAYYSFPSWEGENNYAQPTLRTPTVHRRGNTGDASVIKVMVQDSGGHVVKGNPYLPDVIWLNSGSADYHATGVAGNVCMQNHSSLFGGAKGLSEIYSAPGWGDVECPEAWDLGMQAGVSYGNCSWWNFNKGSIVFLDRYFDFIIRNYGVQMFKSNGNQGGGSEPYSTSPGNGYNVLCTGCYNDGDTVKWGDDYMASYSSWWNPVEGHEKPEIASPGDDVDTTATSAPWIYYGFGGTSSASPLSMGVATLVGSRAPSILTHSQAIKAIMMVSAWHNVEGDAVVSDKDGAGGVHAGAADAVARDNQFEIGTFVDSSFPYDKTVHLYEGDGTRVICLWHSDPDAAMTTDVLKMDLDITVLDPDSNVVASSAHDKNPFELVYFEPPKTGEYTIRLTKQTFLGETEPYCIAWSTHMDAATAEVEFVGTGAIGSTLDINFFNPYHAGESFVGVLSLGTLPELINMDDGYILPVAFDMLAYACVFGALPGFVGTLDSSGEASTSVHLPNSTGLIGMDLYLSMVNVDLGRLVPVDTAELAVITLTN